MCWCQSLVATVLSSKRMPEEVVAGAADEVMTLEGVVLSWRAMGRREMVGMDGTEGANKSLVAHASTMAKHIL